MSLSESARRDRRAESAVNTPLSGERGTRHGVGSQHVIWQSDGIGVGDATQAKPGRQSIHPYQEQEQEQAMLCSMTRPRSAVCARKNLIMRKVKVIPLFGVINLLVHLIQQRDSLGSGGGGSAKVSSTHYHGTHYSLFVQYSSFSYLRFVLA